MAPSRKQPRRGPGAPRKTEDGFRKALFVRATPEMLAALDAWAEDLRVERGTSVSRGDVVREALHRALQDRAKRAGR